MREKARPPEHPAVATVLNNIGRLDRDLNRDAMPCRRSSARSQSSGAAPASIARTLHWLPQLPDTADELIALARDIAQRMLYLGRDARTFSTQMPARSWSRIGRGFRSRRPPDHVDVRAAQERAKNRSRRGVMFPVGTA